MPRRSSGSDPLLHPAPPQAIAAGLFHAPHTVFLATHRFCRHPPGSWLPTDFADTHQSSVGASLLAMAVGQAASMLNVPAPSRTPTGIVVARRFSRHKKGAFRRPLSTLLKTCSAPPFAAPQGSRCATGFPGSSSPGNARPSRGCDARSRTPRTGRSAC